MVLSMKVGACRVLFFVLLLGSLPVSASLRYSFSFGLQGQASGKALIFVPFRVYYEAAATVQLTAISRPGERLRLVYESVPTPGYVLRTLGFSGKSGAILVAAPDYPQAKTFASARIERWQKESPEYGARVSGVKVFPYQVASTLRSSFLFDRTPLGVHEAASERVAIQYEYYPSVHGLYFRVFPMAAELQGMYNHPFLPAGATGPWGELPEYWDGPPVDYSETLTRVAWLTEKVVKSVMTVRQQKPVTLRYRVTSRTETQLEIVGESRPDVPLWKGFMLREVRRTVRLRPADQSLLLDEIHLTIGNDKGQSMAGHCQLKRIE